MSANRKTTGTTPEERRARREARRAKQRSENAGRAARMHAARIEWERESRHALLQNVASSPPRLNVGCSGWFYWHWRGGFYAKDVPTKNWFNHYTDHFQTVELNAPFYSWPTPATVQGWVRQIGRQKKFVYTIKVSELITHVKRFAGTKTLVRDFGYIADLLGSHMGCFLFQLPPSFRYTRARLDRILSQLDPARRNVVEFRHRGGRVMDRQFFVAAIIGAPALWAESRESIREGDIVDAIEKGSVAFQSMFETKVQYFISGGIKGEAEAIALTCPLISEEMFDSEQSLEVAVIDVASAAELIGLATTAAFGKWRDNRNVHLTKAKRVSVQSRKGIPAIFDGENVNLGASAEIDFVSRAVNVLVPAK
jgi:hypothetical protein